MGFMGVWSVLLVVGAVGGVTCAAVAGRRSLRGRSPSGLDAEAEANQWLVRLAGGLVPPDVRAWAGAGEDTARALTSAAECHRAARARLATARTAAEYAEVTRTAREGLEHLGRARAGLGRETATVSPTAGRGRAKAPPAEPCPAG
ncbi:hypothetical protein P1P75_16330 [Streptomyces sp. ID05-39B]|uniref:hypothetical protein n=1 Tax=Streptomyces sp. ID05-39B TaxID=3028664 RepID=UPI0029BCC0EF|nr:hypothetical protein [Streptomyces sp. ID05-39B]MDX3527960.1 hypothetical protein [Streptomyces sp. ID05-39B]